MNILNRIRVERALERNESIDDPRDESLRASLRTQRRVDEMLRDVPPDVRASGRFEEIASRLERDRRVFPIRALGTLAAAIVIVAGVALWRPAPPEPPVPIARVAMVTDLIGPAAHAGTGVENRLRHEVDAIVEDGRRLRRLLFAGLPGTLDE